MGASTRSKRWGKISPSRASASGRSKLRRYGSCGIPAAATVCAPFWKTGLGAVSLPARFAPSAATTTTAAPGTPSAATTAAGTAATATAAECAIRFGPRFIHIQRASPHGESVECGNRLVRLRFVIHLDKGKPARTAGIAICHDVRAAHLAVLLEQAAHSLFRCLKIEVAHENLLHSLLLLIDAGLIEEETKAGKCSRRSRNSLPDSRKLSNALQIYHARTARGKVGRPILAAAGFSRLPVLPSPPVDIQLPPSFMNPRGPTFLWDRRFRLPTDFFHSFRAPSCLCAGPIKVTRRAAPSAPCAWGRESRCPLRGTGAPGACAVHCAR